MFTDRSFSLGICVGKKNKNKYNLPPVFLFYSDTTTTLTTFLTLDVWGFSPTTRNSL